MVTSICAIPKRSIRCESNPCKERSRLPS